jgi:hypothetical protein
MCLGEFSERVRFLLCQSPQSSSKTRLERLILPHSHICPCARISNGLVIARREAGTKRQIFFGGRNPKLDPRRYSSLPARVFLRYRSEEPRLFTSAHRLKASGQCVLRVNIGQDQK